MGEQVKPGSGRITSVDVLRALAIFGMGWSGMVPYRTLPAWMYHAQLPPPTRVFNDQVFGITWVDLVFPFFIFTMGAAIPLALSSRLAKADGIGRTILGVLWRGLLIAAFALLGQHLRPYAVHPEDPLPFSVLLFAVWGMALLVLIFLRFPDSWPRRRVISIQVAGWILAIATIAFTAYPDGVGFDSHRNDIILMVLANVAVSGSLIWLFTKERPWLRGAVFAAVMMIFLTSTMNGVGQAIWNFDPMNFFRVGHWPYLFDFDAWRYSRFVPIFYHFAYHKYLLILIPGTFCGDMLLRWRRDPNGEPLWTRTADITVTVLGVLANGVACVGLLGRAVGVTFVAELAIAAALILLTQKPGSRTERLIRDFVWWGAALTLVGLLAEPLGGGIRKDEATISYFLVTSGLAFYCLASLTCLIEKLKARMTLVSEAGQNPIFAYIAITNAVPAIFGLTFVWQAIDQTEIGPWTRLALAFVRCIFVLYLAALFTRKKLFLRA